MIFLGYAISFSKYLEPTIDGFLTLGEQDGVWNFEEEGLLVANVYDSYEIITNNADFDLDNSGLSVSQEVGSTVYEGI